jgi:hypothetical protein
MITHIATAATEQSSASEQVNQNMDQIARLVKESAIGSQQAAKACQDLSGLALDLQKMVGNFQIGEAKSYGESSWKKNRICEVATPGAKPAKTLAAVAH